MLFAVMERDGKMDDTAMLLLTIGMTMIVIGFGVVIVGSVVAFIS